MVGEVLADRQVGVERAALEHHADLGKRRPGLAAKVVPADLDTARDVVVEARDSENSVVLPAPLTPSRATNAPSRTVSDTSSSALSLPKAWLTPLTARTGVTRW